MANREGSIYFSVFFNSHGVWVKTGAAPEGEGSYDCLLLLRNASPGSKQTTVFNISSANTTNRGFRSAHVPTISDPPLFTFFVFLLSCCDAEIHACWFWEVPHANPRILKNTIIIDLLMGLFRGAVFRHGGGA